MLRDETIDKILDMLRAEMRAHIDTRLSLEASQRAAEALHTEKLTLVNKVTSLELKIGDFRKKGERYDALWNAAKALSQKISGLNSPELTALDAALSASRDDCDEIPF